MQKTTKISIAVSIILTLAIINAIYTNTLPQQNSTTPTPAPTTDIDPFTPSPTPTLAGNFSVVEIKKPTSTGTEYVFVWHGLSSCVTYQKDGYTFTGSVENNMEVSLTFKYTLKIYNDLHLLIDVKV
jgi:hypothetical protein